MSEAPLPDQLEAARGLLSGTGEGRKRGREDSPESGSWAGEGGGAEHARGDFWQGFLDPWNGAVILGAMPRGADPERMDSVEWKPGSAAAAA